MNAVSHVEVKRNNMQAKANLNLKLWWIEAIIRFSVWSFGYTKIVLSAGFKEWLYVLIIWHEKLNTFSFSFVHKSRPSNCFSLQQTAEECGLLLSSSTRMFHTKEKWKLGKLTGVSVGTEKTENGNFSSLSHFLISFTSLYFPTCVRV